MKKHTNFFSEINSYRGQVLLDGIIMALIIVTFIAGILIVLDYIFGAEEVTNYIAQLFL